MTLKDSYRFMHQHGGGIVGRHAEGALALARAEIRAQDEGLEVIWEDDDLPYEHGCMSDEEVAAKFESGEWLGPFYARIERDGEVVASLSGIVLGPNDPYKRVVEAELYLEAQAD